jgi:endonuclease YncB( thermonuclease family)
MLRILVLMVVLLVWPGEVAGQSQLGGRASVVDGDTLEIQGVRIRLWGIDAPEGNQTCLDAAGRVWPCGRRAAFALSDYLGQRTVHCQRRSTDRHGRMVAVCSVGGVEINRWLVEQGWALDFARFSQGHYADSQQRAQQKRSGLWQGSFVPPWEYRRGR